MLEQKKVTLEIAGIPMPSFVQLMLKQSINEHHYFEITLDIQAIEAYGVEIPEASKDWVGKKVIMDFGGTIFVGVATMVGLHRSGGTHGNIKVTGYSSTFLLESDHTCASWCNKSLSDIVKELTDKAGVQALVNPETKSKLEIRMPVTRKPTSDSYNACPPISGMALLRRTEPCIRKATGRLDDQADIRRGTIRARCLLAGTCPTNKGKFLPFGERPDL